MDLHLCPSCWIQYMVHKQISVLSREIDVTVCEIKETAQRNWKIYFKQMPKRLSALYIDTCHNGHTLPFSQRPSIFCILSMLTCWILFNFCVSSVSAMICLKSQAGKKCWVFIQEKKCMIDDGGKITVLTARKKVGHNLTTISLGLLVCGKKFFLVVLTVLDRIHSVCYADDVRLSPREIYWTSGFGIR